MQLFTNVARNLGRCALGLAACASTLSAEDFIKELKFDLKGQIYAENTDFGAGQDRMGSRTDLHFQRLRLVVSGKFDEVWVRDDNYPCASVTTTPGRLE